MARQSACDQRDFTDSQMEDRQMKLDTEDRQEYVPPEVVTQQRIRDVTGIDGLISGVLDGD